MVIPPLQTARRRSPVRERYLATPGASSPSTDQHPPPGRDDSAVDRFFANSDETAARYHQVALTEAGSQFASSRSSNRVPPLSGCWRPTPPAKRYRYQSGEKAASHDSAAVPADAVARESDARGDLRPASRPGPGRSVH